MRTRLRLLWRNLCCIILALGSHEIRLPSILNEPRYSLPVLKFWDIVIRSSLSLVSFFPLFDLPLLGTQHQVIECSNCSLIFIRRKLVRAESLVNIE